MHTTPVWYFQLLPPAWDRATPCTHTFVSVSQCWPWVAGRYFARQSYLRNREPAIHHYSRLRHCRSVGFGLTNEASVSWVSPSSWRCPSNGSELLDGSTSRVPQSPIWMPFSALPTSFTVDLSKEQRWWHGLNTALNFLLLNKLVHYLYVQPKHETSQSSPINGNLHKHLCTRVSWAS